MRETRSLRGGEGEGEEAGRERRGGKRGGRGGEGGGGGVEGDRSGKMIEWHQIEKYAQHVS